MEDTTNTPSVDTDVSVETGTEEAVAAQPAKSTKDVIAEITGWKDIPDDETAIKRIRDLQSYVGKQNEQKTEEAKKHLTESGEFITKEQYETDMFFSKNEQYARDRELIEALALKNNVSVREAVDLPVYKSTSEQITGYQKSKEGENVLKSNPRITETKDSVEKSRDFLAKGDTKAAEGSAVDAVLKSLGQ